MNDALATAPQPRRIGRSVLAVLAGFVVGVVLSIGTDACMVALGIFPPLTQPMGSRLLAIALAYRIVYTILCSYITAWLAPYRPMLHSLVGGFIGFVISAVGAAVTWNRNFGPHWYPVALAVLAIPLAWLGGKLWLIRAER